MTGQLSITILGCGSSGGVPRIGNDWGACDPAEPKNRRRRCSILVERIQDTGERTSVLIDTGPDMREQMLAANVQALDAVLYTHAHADHLHGIDDLRMLALRSGTKVPVYMDAATKSRSVQAFGYCFETPQGSSYPPILDCRPLVTGQQCRIEGAGGSIEFTPIEVLHGDIRALGFRFEDVAYLPDVSDIPDHAISGFSDLKLWILDSLRRRPHPSHFNLDKALEWIERLKPQQAILTNLHNDMDYAVLGDEVPEGVKIAYDGMKITM